LVHAARSPFPARDEAARHAQAVHRAPLAHPGPRRVRHAAHRGRTRLVEYTGERITPAEADRRYPDDAPGRHHTFLFAIDDDVVIDAAFGGNAARWINHSCDPNCDAVIEDARIFIEAIRDIAAGEELAYDYAYVLEERHTPAAKRRFPCNVWRRELPRDDPREEAFRTHPGVAWMPAPLVSSQERLGQHRWVPEPTIV
jgi:SET domain-containing protein